MENATFSSYCCSSARDTRGGLEIVQSERANSRTEEQLNRVPLVGLRPGPEKSS